MENTMGQATGKITGDQYRTEITSGNHSLVVDEPLEKGGKDTGPAPGDLVCAGLASCTAITLQMYAERKGWELPHIKVDVTLVKEGEASVFVRNIDFGPVSLTVEQLNRLAHIANNCPVHKLLSKQNEVRTLLKP